VAPDEAVVGERAVLGVVLDRVVTNAVDEARHHPRVVADGEGDAVPHGVDVSADDGHVAGLDGDAVVLVHLGPGVEPPGAVGVADPIVVVDEAAADGAARSLVGEAELDRRDGVVRARQEAVPQIEGHGLGAGS
jgi:hypothetical protein